MKERKRERALQQVIKRREQFDLTEDSRARAVKEREEKNQLVKYFKA